LQEAKGTDRITGVTSLETSSDPSEAKGRQRLLSGRLLGTAAGVALGLILLVGAWSKALDPHAFAEQIEIEGLDFLFSSKTVAFIALAIEAALGTALVLGIRRLWILIPTAALVVFFLFLTGRTYWYFAHGQLDEIASCGCFGALFERTPAEAFWQDLALLVPSLLLAFLGRSGSAPTTPRLRLAVTVVVTLGALLFAWRAPQLPLDNLATRLRPGTRTAELCASDGETRLCLSSLVPELEAGEHLVILADLEDPSLGEAVESLNAYALSSEGTTLWALSAASAQQRHSFFWQWGPVFEIREVPESLLRPLYRKLPRSFLVQDGTVTHTFSGMPPQASLVGVSPQPGEAGS
jgi:hypothetical protein